jgi:hypothetical protein
MVTAKVTIPIDALIIITVLSKSNMMPPCNTYVITSMSNSGKE